MTITAYSEQQTSKSNANDRIYLPNPGWAVDASDRVYISMNTNPGGNGRFVRLFIPQDDVLAMAIKQAGGRRALIDHLTDLEREEANDNAATSLANQLKLAEVEAQLKEARAKLDEHAKFRAIGGAL